jgi:hypothetical protein
MHDPFAAGEYAVEVSAKLQALAEQIDAAAH